MRYEIVFAREAAEDMRRLSADHRSRAKRAIETHLRHEPKKTSRSRIKRLQGISQPQFRLRVDDLRVYYDVEAGLVTILAVVAKSESADWLGRLGGRE